MSFNPDLPTADFYGYQIYSGTKAELIKEATNHVLEKRRFIVFAMNPNKFVASYEDSHVKNAINSADTLIADGIGITIISRILKGVKLERITGIDLMDSLLYAFAAVSSPVFFYGAKEEVLKNAIIEIKKKYPSLVLSGMLDGYSATSEQAVSAIKNSGAQCLFVALGSPKQEEFIAKCMDELEGVTFAMGVGGSLDVISGFMPRAPKAMQKIGLEWVHRLLFNPKRIGRNKIARYLLLILKEHFCNK